MLVGELKKQLESWNDGDLVEVSCGLLAEHEGVDYCWLEVKGINDGFKGVEGQSLLLIETGGVMGS